jgi:hypothetical protein
MSKLNNLVEGLGCDEIGTFKWSGTVNKDGKANLVK